MVVAIWVRMVIAVETGGALHGRHDTPTPPAPAEHGDAHFKSIGIWESAANTDLLRDAPPPRTTWLRAQNVAVHQARSGVRLSSSPPRPPVGCAVPYERTVPVPR